MGKRNNRRTGRSQPTATFNRLHQIILARETNQTLLQTTAVLHRTTILRQTITNTPYLYPNHSSLYVNTTFQQQYIQFPHPALFNQQLPTTPFVPSFYHHPNYNTIRPSSATHLFDRDGTPCNIQRHQPPHTHFRLTSATSRNLQRLFAVFPIPIHRDGSGTDPSRLPHNNRFGTTPTKIRPNLPSSFQPPSSSSTLIAFFSTTLSSYVSCTTPAAKLESRRLNYKGEYYFISFFLSHTL